MFYAKYRFSSFKNMSYYTNSPMFVSTAPDTPYTSMSQTQPTPLPVEYIAAIGGGGTLLLVKEGKEKTT